LWIIETIDGSVIQHGRHNDRIYLMHLYEAAETRLIAKLDAMAMANGYGKIFAKIPATRWKAFKSAGYVREAVIPGFFKGMANNALYFCIRVGKKIAALAAAEIDPASQTCEMTDFATLPDYGGRGFAKKLLVHLEDEAHHRGVKTAYTIARADSHAMNRTFEKTGYHYAGRLINNSQIGGCIRSMTVWYKHLQNIITR
jgi:ribosomal protein S18 acetylase RimI-like enzyme